jgi:ubiquinone biosynthesis protein UbiJ
VAEIAALREQIAAAETERRDAGELEIAAKHAEIDALKGQIAEFEASLQRPSAESWSRASSGRFAKS